MKIANIMRTDIVVAKADAPFESLLRKQACLMPQIIHVVDDAMHLLGVITSLDLLRPMLPAYLDSRLAGALADDLDMVRSRIIKNRDKQARDLMTADVFFVSPDATFLEADALIVEKRINAIPVVDDRGVLVGEICRRDILRYLVVETCHLQCELRRDGALADED